MDETPDRSSLQAILREEEKQRFGPVVVMAALGVIVSAGALLAPSTLVGIGEPVPGDNLLEVAKDPALALADLSPSVRRELFTSSTWESVRLLELDCTKPGLVVTFSERDLMAGAVATARSVEEMAADAGIQRIPGLGREMEEHARKAPTLLAEARAFEQGSLREQRFRDSLCSYRQKTKDIVARHSKNNQRPGGPGKKPGA